MGKKNLKKIVFHSSFEEQTLFGQQHAVELNYEERLFEMYRLNRKLFGENYGKVSKKVTQLYSILPCESLSDFYKRIKS